MATPSNHWKLGLFVVCGISLGLASVVVFGARGLQKESVSYRTYFDESVQGLEVGSPVKFRGVTVGSVSKIDIAPDRRHVGVTSDLGVEEINLMGLGHGKGSDLQIHVPPDLRIQLASAGITGVKFMQLDFFAVKGNPVPTLPFPVPENYIPAAVSTMKNLEDAIVSAVARIPEMTDAALRLIEKLDGLVNDVGQAQLPERTIKTLVSVEQTFSGVRTSLAELEAGKISTQAQATLGRLDGAIARVDKLIERVGSDQGVVVSAERASNAMGDVAVNARGLTDDLGTTLREVQQAAESIQRLTNALERDSDMLLKGRAQGTP
ncbi:MAG TPA: MlaD family protein [Polyangiaceae bacterium]|nr:MlaD family protein [Polyangiaceae bacterium]